MDKIAHSMDKLSQKQKVEAVVNETEYNSLYPASMVGANKHLL